MRLCLVEDNAVAGLEPLTLTRPAFDLLLGATTLGEKIARALGVGPGPRRRAAGRPPLPRPRLPRRRPPRRRQRPRLARPRARLRRQRPLGPPRRLRAPRRRRPLARHLRRTPRPGPGRPRGRPSASSPAPSTPGSTTWPPGSTPSSWAGPGSTAPGTWSRTTPPTSNATSRPAGRRGLSNRHLAAAAVVGPARHLCSPRRRRGSTPTRSSTPPTARSRSRPAPGSSRSRGSRGRATWAATRTCSAPTCAGG